MQRIAIAGFGGRMGQMLLEAVLGASDMQLSGALASPRSPALGQDAGAALGKKTGVTVTADTVEAIEGCDVLIDFTRPEHTLTHLAATSARGIPIVIGTTGFDEAGKAAISAASRKSAIVFAPNMSVGVNVTMKLIEQAARALTVGYDVEIVEAHHRNKIDAPSGTAIKMGEVVARAWGKNLEDLRIPAREGETGIRPEGRIGFASVRAGDIVGDHTVLFAGPGERIEITHRSSSRNTYAEGSLVAARFLKGRQSGLYDMFDVLGLAGE